LSHVILVKFISKNFFNLASFYKDVKPFSLFKTNYNQIFCVKQAVTSRKGLYGKLNDIGKTKQGPDKAF
jgi:hypothetical protein